MVQFGSMFLCLMAVGASEVVGLKSQPACYTITKDKDYDPRNGGPEYCAPSPWDDVFSCGKFMHDGTCTGAGHGCLGTCTDAGFPVCCALFDKETDHRQTWFTSATKCSDLHSNVGNKDHEYKYKPCQNQTVIV